MKFIIQQVASAKIFCYDRTNTLLCNEKIGYGVLIFVGFGALDNEKKLDLAVKKIVNYGFLTGNNGKIGETLSGKEVLLISNFTIYGKFKKGNKPDFSDALEFKKAENLYLKLIDDLKSYVDLKRAEFGSYMEIESKMIGPVSWILEV